MGEQGEFYKGTKIADQKWFPQLSLNSKLFLFITLIMTVPYPHEKMVSLIFLTRSFLHFPKKMIMSLIKVSLKKQTVCSERSIPERTRELSNTQMVGHMRLKNVVLSFNFNMRLGLRFPLLIYSYVLLLLLGARLFNIMECPAEMAAKKYTECKTWSMNNSFLFCFTTITTIGYGTMAPVTRLGRGFCIIYILVGVPLNGALIRGLAVLLRTKVGGIHEGVRGVPEDGSNSIKCHVKSRYWIWVKCKGSLSC